MVGYFIQFMYFFWYSVFSIECKVTSELLSMFVVLQFLCHVAIDVYHRNIFDFYELLIESESTSRFYFNIKALY